MNPMHESVRRAFCATVGITLAVGSAAVAAQTSATTAAANAYVGTPAVSAAPGTRSSAGQAGSSVPMGTDVGVTEQHGTSNADRHVDAKPIHELETAAQHLRDAIHAMADAPAGPKRTAAIREANHALARTQEAMANLPSDLLLADAREGDYAKAVDRLQQAAQDLRDASHALARDPAGNQRNTAMKRINKALLDTQQTMLDAYLTSSR